MDSAPKEIKELVERFERNIESYKGQGYNEAQVRREFIDPFFEALGWDVSNKAGIAEAYKDVIHEDAIKIGGETKAPDYCFRIGGTRKFFLEAKKPAIDIGDSEESAYQLRRYAWSAKLPLSILTNFEKFAVYDCLVRPQHTERANTARTIYMTYKDYVEQWDEIAAIFSKDAVLKGSFDKYAAKAEGKRGTSTVDKEFLKEIEGWRKELATYIARQNRDIGSTELSFAVQRTIDRILFLRMCEDWGIESYGQLMALKNGGGIYRRLVELFEKADAKYNSGLFYFKQEKGRNEPPDELTLGLDVPDEPISWILHNLYYPQPYDFRVFPAEILGNVYEQFLGKVIRITPGRVVKIEDKPEVKKAGGVYYTPEYIVDYIVKNTVGKLCEGKTPKEISKLKILDPACGSGSFLLGAYTYLLNYLRDWYVEDGPEKHTKHIYQGRGGQWYLTIKEKKQILTNNIYGVDIDFQAVEVTKLSLLLKVLEGENQETVGSQYRIYHERALPDLGNNIKCGNSLIGTDFYEMPGADRFSDEDKRRINAFDWEKEFQPILKQGGFDALIGNPPYVLLQTLNDRNVFNYLAKYFQAARYKIDTYHLFLEVGIKLTKSGGIDGFITPNTFLRNQHARELRHLLLTSSEIQELLMFDYSVFKGASVDTTIIICERSKKPSQKHPILIARSHENGIISNQQYIEQRDWMSHPREEFVVSIKKETSKVIKKINSNSFELKDIATAYFGIQTFDRDRFVSDRKITSNYQPVVDGSNIDRYILSPSKEFVDFRPKSIKSGGKLFVYRQERIGVRQIGNFPIATLLPDGIFTLNTIYNIFTNKKTDYKLRFLLGVICSKATKFYWQMLFFDQKKLFPKIKKPDLLSIRVPKIDFEVSLDKAKHDKMVKLVDRMLELNKKAAKAKLPTEKERLQREINETDKQIDTLVYELYGLTDEEIRIVEGKETKKDR